MIASNYALFVTLLTIASAEPDRLKPLNKNHWTNDAVRGLAQFAKFIPEAGPFIFAGLMGLNTLLRINPHSHRGRTISIKHVDEQFGQVLRAIEGVKAQVPIEVEINSRLSELYQIINLVRTYYNEYDYKYRSGKLSYDSQEAQAFVNNFYTNQNLKALLNSIPDILIGDQQKMNLLQNLATTKNLETYLCRRDNSHQSRLIGIRQDILETEMKALKLAQFRYMVTVKATNSSEIKRHAFVEFQYYVALYVNRTMKIQRDLVGAIRFASRHFWKCDPGFRSEGETFITLDPIFRTHVVYERILKVKEGGYPGDAFATIGNCDDLGPMKEKPRSRGMRYEPVCKGLVRDCKDSNNIVNVCYNRVGDRFKYEAIKFKGGKTWGKQDTCTYSTRYSLFGHEFGPDDICLCKCDELEDDQAVRYFSTLKCASDYRNNKVITGVRLIKHGLYIHFEIQQAVMGGYANLDMDTVEWTQNCTNRPESDFAQKQNLYKVTWDNRSVNLDDLECRNDSVVTGVRFNNDLGSLRLELECTPFDYTSGRLNTDLQKIKFVSGNRKPARIDNHLPTAIDNTKVLEKYGHKIEFITSNNEEDAGSSVVPFIDIQRVSEKIPSPLAGVSLIHRDHKQSSGYLALQIKPFDYSRHLGLESEDHYEEFFEQFFENLANRDGIPTSR